MKAKTLPDDYPAFLAALKQRIELARLTAARAVQGSLILLYWEIGRGIVQKQQGSGWGDAIVEKLAADLRAAFPLVRGFSPDNLWRIRQFYSEYADPDFLEPAVPESRPVAAFLEPFVPETSTPLASGLNLALYGLELLITVPWGHHLEIIKKAKDPAARLYYLRATSRFGWTRVVLLNQIKARAYERTLAEGKTHNFPSTLPGTLAAQAEETLKSSYNLEFLGIHREIKERELEDQLLSQIQRFILELGYGFCFIGRQHRLTLGKKEYFIDLLFYHRFLKALVAIELKLGSFEPEHAGKMDFYLNLLDEKERAVGDAPSIGIILCGEKDNLEVEFALRSKANPIGVAEYQLVPKLPKELQGKLPTARQLADAVQQALPHSSSK